MLLYIPFFTFIVNGTPVNEIDYTAEFVLYADGYMYSSSGHPEFGSDLVDDSPWMCSGSIEELVRYLEAKAAKAYLSILLTKDILGTLYLLICLSTVIV